MQDFVFFLGRFHVLALHLPIGIVFLAVVLDWASHRPGRGALAKVSPFVWCLAAISAVLTVALGYMHFAEGGFTGPSAAAHRLYGTLVAIACVGIWWLSSMRPALYRRFSTVAGLALIALVSVTGHYGGNLTHGSEFLVEYAPQPLRSLAGFGTRRPAVTNLAEADPWHDVVQPLLDRRCASCHNDDKRSGELSVVDFAALMRGGETGSVLVPGNVAVSELYRRITLPEDDEAFMPAEGKTPLTADQVEILRWWIEAGGPVDTTVAAVGTTPGIDALLRIEVGLDGATAAGAAGGTGSDAPQQADAAIVDALFEAGFLARQVSQSDPLLTVSVHSVGDDLDDDQLAALKDAASAIVGLDLQSAGIDDAALAGFDTFASLTSLRLSNNELTDAGIGELRNLGNLEILNLYGNPGVTDASIAILASMPSLRSVYLWQTGVSADGLAELRRLRPALAVQGATEVSAPTER